MEFLFILSMGKKKSEDNSICHSSSFPILPLSSRKAVKRSTNQFPPKTKGFINYVFCRNWAVRNPAGTRLDSSSLVNKQVVCTNSEYSIHSNCSELVDCTGFAQCSAIFWDSSSFVYRNTITLLEY